MKLSGSVNRPSKSSSTIYRDHVQQLLHYLLTLTRHQQMKIENLQSQSKTHQLLYNEKLVQLQKKVDQKCSLEKEYFRYFAQLLATKKQEYQRGQNEYADIIREKTELLLAASTAEEAEAAVRKPI